MSKKILTAVRKDISKGRDSFFSIDNELFSIEKKRHLKNISLNNGKFFILPIDQGLEHGPSDFLVNPEAANPEFQLKLAIEGGFSAIALQIGLAIKYWQKPKYKKSIPLVLKVNGRTCLPGDEMAFSPLNTSVSEAIDLGADAIGYTLYVGSPRQDEDLLQLREIRQKAHKNNLPLIVWAYPRGVVASNDGGKDSLAAVDYAVRVAMEVGADLVKFNLPKFPENGFDPKGRFGLYNELKDLSQEERLIKVVRSAGELGTLLSGGNNTDEKNVLNYAKMAMNTGLDGIIFGRNVWQREWKEVVDLSGKLKKILLEAKRK